MSFNMIVSVCVYVYVFSLQKFSKQYKLSASLF